jgi:hypothetical protein
MAKAKQPKRSPVTSAQLVDMINAMSRKDRLSVARDLERSAKAMLRFAKMVRR